MDVKTMMMALGRKIREWLEIDYMEYSSDANAQAEYVSNAASYRYYRIYYTDYNTEALIAQFQLYNGEALITPSNMTGDSSPSPYVVSALYSYEGDANWRKYFAFDSYIDTSPTGGCGFNGQTTAPNWLKIDLGSSQKATSYKIWSTGAPTSTRCPRDWVIQGSNDDSTWITLDTQVDVNNWAGHTAFTGTLTPVLQSYSEATIKTQGSYSLKVVAAQTNSLNKTLTKNFSPAKDLSGKTQIKYDVRASRTGSNFKLGWHDSGGTTTEHTPNILKADVFQTETVDISAVADANKDAIDSLITTILNADSANTIYIDNVRYS